MDRFLNQESFDKQSRFTLVHTGVVLPSIRHRYLSETAIPTNQATPNTDRRTSSNADIQNDMESLNIGPKHTVVAGDSLWQIAAAAYGCGTAWPIIQEANSDAVFQNGQLIFVGAELDIPSFNTGEIPASRQEVSTTICANGGAVAGQRHETRYGVYEVFPDFAIRDLNPSHRINATISIGRSDFEQLQRHMSDIESNARAVSIGGSSQFIGAVLSDFGWLLSQSIGRGLIHALNGAGHRVDIQETTGGNIASYRNGADSWMNQDGTPGTGCNVIVYYNSINWNPYGGSQPWMTRPPAIGLAHELVHALSGMSGTRARGADEDGINNREQQATGLAEWSHHEFSENRFRSAFGLPIRTRF